MRWRGLGPWIVMIAALLAFAGNSLLCRAALSDRSIDAATFTAVRVASGAAALFAIYFVRVVIMPADAILYDEPRVNRGSWLSAFALFAYAIAFSVAYLRLTAATGALVLFATVQVTMVGFGIARGRRPRALEWLGLAIASGGLVVLLWPKLAAPDPLGAVLMAIAGISWGAYTLRGQLAAPRSTVDPLAITADNFARAIPFAAAALAIALAASDVHVSARGIVLAIVSGAIASGVGYSLWYAVLPALGATFAAIVQLVVPVLTAMAAVVFLDEALTVPVVIATIAIVGGIAIAIRAKPV